MRLSYEDEPSWDCDDCGRQFDHPFRVDKDGRFAWSWSERYPRPNPGCPWCGTCNIGYYGSTHELPGQWRCYQESCRKFWRGEWIRIDDDWTRDRWKIHVPVSTVPWASGTVADLECWRRCAFSVGGGGYHPNCCRFPKSCRAFDPGFTTGKGPTTLPIVWFDGFTWRSGPPDTNTIPRHLLRDIWLRWLAVKPQEVSDDDDDDSGTRCDCSRCR